MNNTNVVVGNRSLGERSFEGVLHYCAFYSTALTTAEIDANTGRLLLNDDG